MVTPDQAVAVLDDALAVWSTQALEDKPESAEPFELQALGRARDALEVLRRLAAEDEQRRLAA